MTIEPKDGLSYATHPPQIDKFVLRRDGNRTIHLSMFMRENVDVFGPRLREALDAIDC